MKTLVVSVNNVFRHKGIVEFECIGDFCDKQIKIERKTGVSPTSTELQD
tara:strand:- start:342 stop:488 length:147 start_codon:yes stop_codon:yes gene_type:complete